jgi:hypothetical protein
MKRAPAHYHLEKTIERPYMGLRTIAWMPTSARYPEHGQRVIWTGLRGQQVHGTYRGDNQWDADPTDERAAHRIQYRPSLWRPE